MSKYQNLAAQITDIQHIKDFLFAGNATFTIVSKKTGTRFTYNLKENKNRYFLKLLGGDNKWQNAGVMFNKTTYYNGQYSKIKKDAKSIIAFTWFLKQLTQNKPLDQLEFWHAGKCGKCARMLTVPESIKIGLGPICAIIKEQEQKDSYDYDKIKSQMKMSF